MRYRLLQHFGADFDRGASLVASSFWSIVLRLVGAAAAFATGVLLARALGPEGLGTYGVVAAVAAILATLAQLGLPPLATRELAVSSGDRDGTRVRIVVRWFASCVVIAAVALGLLVVAVCTLVDPPTRMVWVWGSILILPTALLFLFGAALRGLDRLIVGQVLEIVIRPMAFAILLIAALALRHQVGPAFAMALNAAGCAAAILIGTVFLRRAVRAVPRVSASTPDPRGWVGSARHFLGTNLVQQLDAQYGVLVTGAVATVAATGTVRVAYSTVGFLNLPNTVASVVLAPTIARLYSTGDRLRLQSFLKTSAGVLFAAQCAIFFGVMLFGKWLINLVFGPVFESAWLPLLMLSAAQVVTAASGLCVTVLAMCGGERVLFRNYFGAVALGIVLAVPLAERWEGTGVTLAVVIAAVVNGFLCCAACRRMMAVDPSIISLLIDRRSPSGR